MLSLSTLAAAVTLACSFALGPVHVSAGALKPAGPNGPSSLNFINPYTAGKAAYANKGYAQKLEETISYFTSRGDSLNAARTRTVQKTPTFRWLSHTSNLPDVKTLVDEALALQRSTGKNQLVQLVVYNLPDRDCSSYASAGEFSLANDGLNKYKAWVDSIASSLSTPDAAKLSFVIIIEPDSLANLVTNGNVGRCSQTAPAYKEGIAYVIAKLQKPNIALYLDAANGGWLGWADNLAPSARLFAEVLALARTKVPGASVRGVVTNVSNYNQYIAPVRENYTEWSPSWDETHFVSSLAPYLIENGVPAHFIVDQGRGGRGGIRTEWGQWCNIRNAGFGNTPTADQAVLQNQYVDALVWVKPGGESDGTSDRSSSRFDETCALPVAHTPSPEAGSWFNEYVANLVKLANPPLQPTY